ncbi:class I tRNA ligase family protein, partial [Candidatus Falkowbacteria bacterium]|nr:class I tRNA ligase family protein [Candidatus Falkowbacteria bacterium]
KDVMDKIEFKCKCKAVMKRIPDVLDCWFESGSMPYAQEHYPFENKKRFEANFPAQFIAEGSDHTRAWFYYLHVVATALFNKPAYKNVIVNGIVLAEDGKKMSKRLKNYPEPDIVMEKYGSDAVRFYLLSSPVMATENINFTETLVKESYQKVVMLLSNILSFYQMYAGDKVKIEPPTHVLDKWILTKLNLLVHEVTKQMDSYDLVRSVRPIQDFINELSTWYIRRSRDRFKSNDKNTQLAVSTLGHVLLTLGKLMAPFTPFIAEHIYQTINYPTLAKGGNGRGGLTEESVHLENWPKPNEKLIDKNLLTQMDLVRTIASQGLEKRATEKIPVRQPLAMITVTGAELKNPELEDLLKDELNIIHIEWKGEKGDLAVELDTKLTPELEALGIARELTRHINSLRKEKGLTIKDRINITYQTQSQKIKQAIESEKSQILKDTLADRIEVGGGEKGVKVKGEVVKIQII